MESLIVYGSLAIIAIAILGYVIFKLVKFFKMPEEEKRKTIVSYLVGLVTMAEEKIGSGHGEEKLAEVERYFKENEEAAGFESGMCIRTGSLRLRRK